MNILLHFRYVFLAFTKSTYRSCSHHLFTLGFSYSFPCIVNNTLFVFRFSESLTINKVDCVVGSSGVEPPTSCLSGMRSNLLSYEPLLLTQPGSTFDLRFKSLWTTFGFSTDGGDEGIRTLDPLLAGQVLSQLSYTPIMGLFPTVPGNRTTTECFESCLRRLFCFFVSYEKSYFNSSCSP